MFFARRRRRKRRPEAGPGPGASASTAAPTPTTASDLLQLFWLLRYPLGLGLLLVSLPWLARESAARISLSNLFFMGLFELFFVALLAVAAGEALVTTSSLILRDAPKRYGLKLPGLPNRLRGQPVRTALWKTLLAVGLAMPVGMAAASTSPAPAYLAWPTMIQGFLVGALLGFRALRRADRAEAAAAMRSPRWLPALHRQAAKRLGLWALAYLSIGFAFFPVWAADGCLRPGMVSLSLCFPSLGYVLLLFIVLAWLLPGAAFVLDRWRWPTLPMLLVVAFGLRFVFGADHTYPIEAVALPEVDEALRVADLDPGDSLSPQEALRAWARRYPRDDQGLRKPRMVVVATAGGGVRASLWTTEVLAGLEGQLGSEFSASLAAISAVSGGSVGTLHYLASMEDRNQARSPDALEALRAAASRSTLRTTLWGLVYPDLLRAPAAPVVALGRRLDLPLARRATSLDRAWALEQSWRRELAALRGPATPEASLYAWREAAREGRLPIPMLNAMTVEQGAPIVFAPINLAQDEHGRFGSIHGFLDRHPGYDVDWVTAARLSSTFPWITPVARPEPVRGPVVMGEHLSDGGYFDNFGIVTLAEWLDAVLPTFLEEGGSEVLVLSIYSRDCDAAAREKGACGADEGAGASAGGDLTVPDLRSFGLKLPEIDEAPPATRVDGASDRRDSRWRSWMAGPVSAMLNARGSTQNVRNAQTLSLLVDRWAGSVEIHHVTFALERDLPLSWQMTPEEQRVVHEAWEAQDVGIDKVRAFLLGQEMSP